MARMIKDATGVAFITDVIGRKRILTALIFDESAAKSVPKNKAEKKPTKIRNDENATAL